MTASWFILIFLVLEKCRMRSQESRNRYFHLPGAAVVLCQDVLFDPAETDFALQMQDQIENVGVAFAVNGLSLIFSTNDPVGLRTRSISAARGANQST